VEPVTAGVEVTVWRRVSNPSLLYVSTRPEGGSWRTLNTPLDMSQRSDSGRFHQSNAVLVEVRLEDGNAVGVQVTVWRRISNPSLLYVSTRPEGGSWRTLNTALDMSQRSDSGRFHQSNAVLVDVPLPDLPEATTPRDRSACVIDEGMAARVIASTVQVITPTGLGSAFYVGNSEFVTAGHVVDDNPSSIRLRNAETSISARLVGFYPFESGDVAILSAAAPSMTALEWAGVLGPGATIAVVGYPEGLGVSASITRGIVSRLFTQQGVSYIQTDSAVSPGNSGGPLVDACGRVAGVVSSSFVGERGSEGLHFAVAEPTLGQLLQRIRTGQSPPPAESSPQTDAGEPTFWDIHELINRVIERENEANSARAAASWDREQTADSQLQYHRALFNTSTSFLDYLEGLSAEKALEEPVVFDWHSALTVRWESLNRNDAADVAYLERRSGLDEIAASWRESLMAFEDLSQAQCALWRLQMYSNADEICHPSDDPNRATAAFWAGIAGPWSLTEVLIGAVRVDWEDRAEAAGLLREQQGLAQGMLNFLGTFRGEPAAENATVSHYVEAAITYWSARVRTYSITVQYALSRVPYSDTAEARDEQAAAWTSFAEAQCELYRLLNFANATGSCGT